MLSVMRHGLGRTAALTTDLNTWAPELAAADDFTLPCASCAGFAKPGVWGDRRQWGGQLLVTVDAVEAGEYLSNRVITARYSAPPSSLNRLAGRYEGVLPGRGEGTLLVTDGDEVVARQVLDQTGAEFDREVASGSLLATLSSRSSGDVLSSLDDYSPDLGSTSLPVWQWPLGAACALFLAELALRRFALPRRPTVSRRTGLRRL